MTDTHHNGGDNMVEHCPQPERDCPFSQIQWGEMVTKIDYLVTLVEKQNGRVRTLENWRWYLVGAIGAIAFWLKFGGKL